MILYKYLHPARIDVLEQKMLRFTQPGDFNDPFEFRPYIQSVGSDEQVRSYLESNFDRLVDLELEKYGALLQPGVGRVLKEALAQDKTRVLESLRHLQPEVFERLSPSIDAMLNKSLGVLCLSEVPDSILMWGHYTDNHRGFAVGFDSDHAFFSRRRSVQDEFGFLRQVKYQRERPKVVFTDTTSTVWFSTKSNQWEYEREWRIVRVLSEADSRRDNSPFPVCLFGFPEDAVLEIIVGLRSPPSLVQRLESLATTFSKARLLRARENPTDYSLVLSNHP